jgi:hypothetical protein
VRGLRLAPGLLLPALSREGRRREGRPGDESREDGRRLEGQSGAVAEAAEEIGVWLMSSLDLVGVMAVLIALWFVWAAWLVTRK